MAKALLETRTAQFDKVIAERDLERAKKQNLKHYMQRLGAVKVLRGMAEVCEGMMLQNPDVMEQIENGTLPVFAPVAQAGAAAQLALNDASNDDMEDDMDDDMDEE